MQENADICTAGIGLTHLALCHRHGHFGALFIQSLIIQYKNSPPQGHFCPLCSNWPSSPSLREQTSSAHKKSGSNKDSTLDLSFNLSFNLMLIICYPKDCNLRHVFVLCYLLENGECPHTWHKQAHYKHVNMITFSLILCEVVMFLINCWSIGNWSKQYKNITFNENSITI